MRQGVPEFAGAPTMSRHRSGALWAIAALLLAVGARPLGAQEMSQQDLQARVQTLTEAVNRAQQQLEESQRQLADLRRQLADLRQQMDPPGQAQAETAQQSLSAEVEALKEEQAMHTTQIATHDQEKVETASKYPLKMTGLILLSGLVNTNRVDVPAAPTLALSGAGSTGFSMRQTQLGLDARGPHLFGASSFADVRVDFFGQAAQSSYGGGYDAAGLLRLRTAHAFLEWEHTQAFFSLDRTILSPNEPTSLTAVATPPLAWSGNLWTWNPQVGASHDFSLPGGYRFRTEAALIDAADPSYTASAAGSVQAPTTVEQSRWPGAEGRLAVAGAQEESGFRFGVGGYFSPHRTPYYGNQFDSWAGTLDYRQPLPARLQLSGSFYRGLGLGGLGGGAFKDYGVRESSLYPSLYFVWPLDAVGGWAELKERASERLQFNAAFGTDSVTAREVRRYPGPVANIYQNLIGNRTYTGNVIYSPSAWLMFSLEYRHLESRYADSSVPSGNVIGAAAGYRF